jgi:hypothetical protein
MKFPIRSMFLLKWVVCAAVPLLFYCQTPIQPPDTDSDYIEFESVWQWCKALSIYQDSSAFDGRIPSDPFIFSQPRDIMLAIHDTLIRYPYLFTFTRYADSGDLNSAALSKSVLQTSHTSTVFLDSLTPSTALLTITTFFDTLVYSDFLACAFQTSHFQNIVFDVRNNGGGYIDQADFIIEALVPSGTPILQIRQRDYDTVAKKYVTLNWQDWVTEEGSLAEFQGKHYAVLMNGWSASASEIFIAALWEGAHKQGDTTRLIGERSFGKGMGQNVVIRHTRKPLLITSLFFRGVSPRIGYYHQKGIVPDTVPQAIIQQGAILADTAKQQIFYAVKMLDSTATPSSINYPAQHNPAPLGKTLPCYYRKIYQDNP